MIQSLRKKDFSTKASIVLGAIFVSILCSLILLNNKAGATLEGFSAGHIMSDAVMSDETSMSEAQIKSFLLNKVSSCTSKGPFSNGSYYYDKLTKPGDGTAYTFNSQGHKYIWKIKNGHFICMAEQTFGGESAARIIYQAARDYDINPRVLIVLLQKEQGLITDSFPNNHQYLAATGYDCPDNGNGCNNQNAGFKKQVRKAAALFREVLSGGWSNYPVGTNYVQYNPNASCGGSNVNIKNRATSALYRYTPYQPNQAALNAGYGTAPCGAYGNRNFYNYFTDWFGSTTTAYDAEVQGLTLYSDSNRTAVINPVNDIYNLSPGQTVYGELGVKNIGSKDLLQSFTRLGTTSPTDRGSNFNDGSWLTSGRVSAIEENSLSPNDTGTFLFSMRVPRDVGNFSEKFGIVAESRLWISKDSVIINMNVTPSQSYDVELVDYDLYYDSAMKARIPSPYSLRPGQKVYGKALFKNIGSATLSNTNLRLGVTSPRDHIDSPFFDSSWYSPTRLVNATESSIPTGQYATFSFTLSAPNSEGVFSDHFGVVADGTTWIDASKININITSNETVPVLVSGTSFFQGESLVASNGYRLIFQGDGNLVLYKDKKPLWHTKTYNKGAHRVVLQGDGNLVVYTASNKPLWASWSQGNGPSRLRLQSDGNLVVYKNGGKHTWATWTNR